ncbi:acyltransferase family protein [Streptomyces poriferorum]|uniref:Acyltransferase n=1 Tax=Streptomyces poriferorum TaxID=2798799 RepID=A0ABY9IXG5_9ACTN|nr:MULTISPECIES: acyltransferase [unclassified Streptomyces]MDP5312260.1 acyltransferase [Streptomyces sp. Alt4]WLQ58692.1 acyltransferase [Streptomyces sp. Alt2]
MTHPSQPSAYPQQPPEPHTVPFPVQPQAGTQLPGQEEWARPAGPASWTQAPVPVPPAPEPEAAPPAAAAPGRDRYLDLLRAVALVRVVVFHLFGWAWLTIVFPSMGVMFALAGSLMARSLARPAWSVVRSRLRRLLPPMWAFLAVVVPMVFLLGWKPVREEGIWWFLKLGCYLLPVGTPPFPWESGSEGGLLETSWAEQAMGPLWYIRAYLWFVLASPLLLKAFRRLPWVTLLAPVGLTAVIGTGLVTVPGTAGEGLIDFAVFGSCWILGFAHNDGLLRTVPRYLTVSMATFLMAFALWWASGHLTEEGWNLDEIPLAQATWSLGFCVILLQYAPSWRQLPGRLAGWDGLVTLANNRAVTIYLWHNLLLMAGFLLIDQLWNVPWVGDHLGTYIDASGNALELIVIWPLIGLMILAVGWVEDVAAKRRPRLWPNGQSRKAGAGSRGAAVPGGTRRR